LDHTKNPQLASHVEHTYEDKYHLSEAMCCIAIASEVMMLSNFGLSADQLCTIKAWANDRTVSLRFRSEEACTLVRIAERKEDSKVEQVTNVSFMGGSISTKTVHTIKEWFWKYECSWELLAVRGVGATPDDMLRLNGRKGNVTITTLTEHSPEPHACAPALLVDVDMTFVLTNLTMADQGPAVPCFKIDRSAASTPRRNKQVDEALEHKSKLMSWAKQVESYLKQLARKQPESSRLNLSTLDASGLFDPVIPLFQEAAEGEGGGAAAAVEAAAEASAASSALVAMAQGPSRVVLSAVDLNAFLSEEQRGLAEKRAELGNAFAAAGLLSAAEAWVVVVADHAARVAAQWGEALDLVEAMLRSQLAAAVGKEVTAADFESYMAFAYRRLFAERFQPLPFCHSVRRSPSHSPEGTVAIVEGDRPIGTFAAQREPLEMGFAVNAATRIRFEGAVWLHGWLRNTFSDSAGEGAELVVTARQFSSFVVVVGTIASATTLEPKHAFIVQNKDEMRVPLTAAALPTPKEFKDAIVSLSPEQQRFAKAVRAMQLSSTLFGVLILQVETCSRTHLGGSIAFYLARFWVARLHLRQFQPLTTCLVSPTWSGETSVGGGASLAPGQPDQGDQADGGPDGAVHQVPDPGGPLGVRPWCGPVAGPRCGQGQRGQRASGHRRHPH
jgi:hypothetical protein